MFALNRFLQVLYRAFIAEVSLIGSGFVYPELRKSIVQIFTRAAIVKNEVPFPSPEQVMDDVLGNTPICACYQSELLG